MRYIMLGKTGIEVSQVGFGGIPIIRLSSAEAVVVLRRAYGKGITLFDTANMYLDSEEKMGLAFDGVRSRLVLASKTRGVRETLPLQPAHPRDAQKAPGPYSTR